MINADLSQMRLNEAAEATGIRQRLDAWRSGGHDPDLARYYYALTPVWAPADRRAHPAYPVLFRLNPANTRLNNWGIYTVEELEAWMRGAGPVVKATACAQRRPPMRL